MFFRESFANLLRESIAGQVIYRLSGRRLCASPYDHKDYVLPKQYAESAIAESAITEFALTDKDQQRSTLQEDKPGDIIVGWDGPDDPEKPTNWPLAQKIIVSLILCVLTTSVYMATAIFTPAEQKIRDQFGCSETELMLGLTLFVWGYGLGPLIFSAMSENPAFYGRNYIFFVAQIIFMALQVPTALANHISSFSVLRFLAGILAAPPLTNAGACLGDMFGFPSLVWAFIAWSVGGISGPFIGPLIGSALVNHNSWRWAFWYTLIQAGGVFLFMIFLLPETSEQAILMRKARHLRRITGNPNIVAPGDILRRNQHWRQILREVLLFPLELVVKEPVLFLINLHLSLVYAVVYLYFEAFPMVFIGIYGFTLVEQGAAYLALLVGCIVAMFLYAPYLSRTLIKPMQRGESPSPEKVFVPPTIVGSLCIPIGILIFAWAATPSAHWIGCLIGAGLFAVGTWVLFQTYCSYLGQLYPTRFASALASNTVMRCLVGGAFPLFGSQLYKNTAIDGWPVGWGCTIIAFIGIGLTGLPVYLWFKGEHLRTKAIEKWGSSLQR